MDSLFDRPATSRLLFLISKFVYRYLRLRLIDYRFFHVYNLSSIIDKPLIYIAQAWGDTFKEYRMTVNFLDLVELRIIYGVNSLDIKGQWGCTLLCVMSGLHRESDALRLKVIICELRLHDFRSYAVIHHQGDGELVGLVAWLVWVLIVQEMPLFTIVIYDTYCVVLEFFHINLNVHAQLAWVRGGLHYNS